MEPGMVTRPAAELLLQPLQFVLGARRQYQAIPLPGSGSCRFGTNAR
tara:strand:+ start:10144 stop:10284 length:141 start_codon:yes stop_codon:yes gene_type:complete